VAREERDPDWGVELMLSQRGSAYSNMLSVAVSIPVTGNRSRLQDRELAASLAQADAMEAEWQEAQRTRGQQIAAWQQDGLAALAQRELIDRERLPLVQQRVDLALAAYRSGAVPLSAVLEARQTRLVLALERIDVELSVARPWAALEALSAPKALNMNPPARGER
jgi:outer membrane protein, heavy metal efflux system